MNLLFFCLSNINIPPSPFKGGDAKVSVHEKNLFFFVYRLDIYDLLHTRLRQLVDFFLLILYRSYIVPISKVKGRYIQKIFLIREMWAKNQNYFVSLQQKAAD